MFVCRTIKWYVTAHMKFVRESLQGIEESSASFRTQPDIIADVDSYEPHELLDAIFNLVAGYVSIGSGWQFDSVQSLTINLYPYRPTVGAGSFIQTPNRCVTRALSISRTSTKIIVCYGPFLPTFIELVKIQTDYTTTANILMSSI